MMQRLRSAAAVMLPGAGAAWSTSRLLQELAVVAKRSARDDEAWLLHIAVCGVFPDHDQLADLRRRLSLAPEGAAIVAVLEATIDLASRPGVGRRTMRLVTDVTVVDVNFCATHNHNTGIQRVVRKTMPHWEEAGRPVEFVAWTADTAGFRTLSPTERKRVLEWDTSDFHGAQGSSSAVSDEHIELIVPWRTAVFLPEVPFQHLCRQLACMAHLSGNDVRIIGYDAIPLVSAESQSHEESERFAHYLTLVKHATAVVAISESAAEEFRGFASALSAQGLSGPVVSAVPLAREAHSKPIPRSLAASRPLILCVGSHEPRKNQDAVLYAAELLHAEGHDFEMVFVGGGSRRAVHHFDERVRRMHRRGFDVTSMRKASDAELAVLFSRARYSVFVSLHEGYGLPVAESLGFGTPVLTSDFGSLDEIARLGGCVQVNPRDDIAIVDGMRRLLTDDALIERLRAEAASVPQRTWETYSTELWEAVRGTERSA